MFTLTYKNLSPDLKADAIFLSSSVCLSSLLSAHISSLNSKLLSLDPVSLGQERFIELYSSIQAEKRFCTSFLSFISSLKQEAQNANGSEFSESEPEFSESEPESR